MSFRYYTNFPPFYATQNFISVQKSPNIDSGPQPHDCSPHQPTLFLWDTGQRYPPLRVGISKWPHPFKFVEWNFIRVSLRNVMKQERGQYSMLNWTQSTILIGCQRRRKACGIGVNIRISGKTAASVWGRDAVHGLPGIFFFFYFHNVIRCHGVRVNAVSFTPIRKVRPSLRRFSWNSQNAQQHYV